MGRVFVAQNAGPAVVGFIRPRIVVPAWALSLAHGSREMLLRHEAEHVRAGDSRTLLTSEFLRIIFPWNAALWWMTRRLRLAIEIDCDSRVLRAGAAAHEYGLLLLAVGERYASSLPLAASLIEPHLNLEDRIVAMTSVRPKRPFLASIPFVALAALMLAVAAQAPRPRPLLAATRRLVSHTPGRDPQSREIPAPAFQTPAVQSKTAILPLVSALGEHATFQPATIRGLTYNIYAAHDEPTFSPQERVLENFDGAVTFARGRGRIDVLRKSGVAPAVIDGMRYSGPTAAPGDYYLFDSTTFILVRARSKTFSRVEITEASNSDATSQRHFAEMHDTFDEWLWPSDPVGPVGGPRNHVPVFWVAQTNRAKLATVDWRKLPGERDGEIILRTEDTGAPENALAAGHFAFSDAPYGEVSVARWLGVTEAIAASHAAGVAFPTGRLWLTSFSTWLSMRRPEMVAIASELSGIRDADVDTSRLVVPPGFAETPWIDLSNPHVPPSQQFNGVDRVARDSLPGNASTAACPLFIIDGVEQPSTCAAPRAPGPQGVSAQIDLLLGVVRGPDGKPLASARVEATSVALQTSCLATTGPDGKYAIRFVDGGAQYQIAVRAQGMMTAVRVISRQAAEDRLQANFTMGTLAGDTVAVASNFSMRTLAGDTIAIASSRSPDAGRVASPHCG